MRPKFSTLDFSHMTRHDPSLLNILFKYQLIQYFFITGSKHITLNQKKLLMSLSSCRFSQHQLPYLIMLLCLYSYPTIECVMVSGIACLVYAQNTKHSVDIFEKISKCIFLCFIILLLGKHEQMFIHSRQEKKKRYMDTTEVQNQ